jgi:hypothetical protein
MDDPDGDHATLCTHPWHPNSAYTSPSASSWRRFQSHTEEGRFNFNSKREKVGVKGLKVGQGGLFWNGQVALCDSELKWREGMHVPSVYAKP